MLLAGLTTAPLNYLMVERIMRPVFARALTQGPAPRRPILPGVEARTLLAWGVGTALPLLGVGTLATLSLLGAAISRDRLAGGALFLTAIGVVVGLLAIRAAARSVAEPIASVRGALAEVEAGRLDEEVPVYDGSEVGLLQAGFNRMVAGLRERERMRDLFGRHVGEDVARAALEGEARLGGEVRDAAALFVDVIGSTALASERPPEEVVGALNEFFAIVVETVGEHSGLVNKFEGDAALCVFGAPVHRSDAATCALAAARTMRERFHSELDILEAGMGVSAGPVVAGNVGAAARFEYTVIGDPVNEAARLTELAKDRPERLLASEEVVARADERERARWRLEPGAVELRGRSRPTRLAAPVVADAAARG